MLPVSFRSPSSTSAGSSLSPRQSSRPPASARSPVAASVASSTDVLPELLEIRIRKTFIDCVESPLEVMLKGFYSRRRTRSCPPALDSRPRRRRVPPALRRITAKAAKRQQAHEAASAGRSRRPPSRGVEVQSRGAGGPGSRQSILLEPSWSTGSEGHASGHCRPCAFLARGCVSGPECDFCHLCDAKERLRRKRERKRLLRAGVSVACVTADSCQTP